MTFCQPVCVDSERGFTLIEIIIALAVVAVAMTALVRTAGIQADGLATLRDRSYAEWVAANAIEELRLDKLVPEPGSRLGNEMMGRQRWYWRLEVSTTDQERVRAVRVWVSARPDLHYPVYQAVAFVGG